MNLGGGTLGERFCGEKVGRRRARSTSAVSKHLLIVEIRASGESAMQEAIRPVLEGKKVLVVGVANDQSIAYGCAKAFRSEGAELAITWLNGLSGESVRAAHHRGDRVRRRRD